MTKLTDTQMVLLSTASQRENGSLYPLPATLRPGGGTAKFIAALAGIGLVEERETSSANVVSRTDGDLRFGMFVTAAGLQAIGIDHEQQPDSDRFDPANVSVTAAAAKPPRNTKITAVLALLQRPHGAILAELIAATGWLPHTTRAALTGLKQKGYKVERFKREGVTCYRVNAA